MTRRNAPRSAPLDWDAARDALARARAALESGGFAAPHDTRAILDARAAALARRAAPPPAEGLLELAELKVGRERYGIGLEWVREVVRLLDCTPVPGTPDFLLGVTNLRGEVLAVIDIRKLFGVPAEGVADLSRLVVVGVERREFGIAADAAPGMVSVAPSEILPFSGSHGDAGRSIRGITRDAMIVLDGGGLLGDDRLQIDHFEGRDA